MVTRIHVVDTLEQTQSLPLAAATPLSLSFSAASLRAWQGHGAVSYYKRSSPSLLQETQTCRSCAPRPRRCFNYSLRQTFYSARARTQGSRKSELCRRPDVCVCMLTAGSSEALRCCCFYHFLQGKVGFLIFHQGHGKSPLFPFKIKMK